MSNGNKMKHEKDYYSIAAIIVIMAAITFAAETTISEGQVTVGEPTINAQSDIEEYIAMERGNE